MGGIDIFKHTPVKQCSALQNLEINNLSLSDTISVGKPFSQYQFLKNSDANASAVMSVRVGTMCISDPNRSVIVRIQLKPSSSGSGPTKSIATDDPLSSGTGRGCNGPRGLIVCDLLCWHCTQPGTYSPGLFSY